MSQGVAKSPHRVVVGVANSKPKYRVGEVVSLNSHYPPHAPEIIVSIDDVDYLTKTYSYTILDNVSGNLLGGNHGCSWDILGKDSELIYSPYSISNGMHNTIQNTISANLEGFVGAPKKVEIIIKKEKTRHRCHCDTFNLVNFGCKCGGI